MKEQTMVNRHKARYLQGADQYCNGAELRQNAATAQEIVDRKSDEEVEAMRETLAECVTAQLVRYRKSRL